MAATTPSDHKSSDSHHSSVVDVEELVKKWAWATFYEFKTKEQGRIPKEFLSLHINWRHVKFHFDQPNYNIVPFASGAGPSKAMQPQVLFRTIFSNVTNREQEYSFKTERSTRSSCTVCFERGITTGGELSVKLATPCEVLEANAGFKRELTVTDVTEDTVEEELSWGVDSQVKVPANTETTAELVITEAQCSGSFTMSIRFHGRVIATYTNMRDNNSLVTVIEGDVADIILREIERGLKGFRLEKRTVVAETKGKCHFKFGIEQRVRITEKPCALTD